MKSDTETRNYFFDMLVDGDLIAPVDEGFFNKPTQIAEFAFGYDSLINGVQQYTVLWGGSQDSKCEIRIDSPIDQWGVGTTGTFLEREYNAAGKYSKIAGNVSLFVAQSSPTIQQIDESGSLLMLLFGLVSMPVACALAKRRKSV
jgi:hypothetical protein